MKSSNQKSEVCCIVSCSVLKRELQQLKAEGKLDADLIFVSKRFHVDFGLLEKYLRKVLQYTKKRFKGKIVLVYGDLCLGANGEMKKLADEYGITKVDALNCIDCQLGGQGAIDRVDPDHNLMFMGPGMINFFEDMRGNLLEMGIDETAYASMFDGIKGFVVLDTCGDGEKLLVDLKKAGLPLKDSEIKNIGTTNFLRVIKDAIEGK